MLVLSRKVGESIKIGDGITVVINRIAGNRVTIGLRAPRNMRIVRGELKLFEDDDSIEVTQRRKQPVAIPEKTDLDFKLETISLTPRRAR
jgi:carbon storage regulator